MTSVGRSTGRAPVKATYPVNPKSNYSSTKIVGSGSAPVSRRLPLGSPGPISSNGSFLSRERLPSSSEAFDYKSSSGGGGRQPLTSGRLSRSGSQQNILVASVNGNNGSSSYYFTHTGGAHRAAVESYQRSNKIYESRNNYNTGTVKRPSIADPIGINGATSSMRRSSSLHRPTSQDSGTIVNNNNVSPNYTDQYKSRYDSEEETVTPMTNTSPTVASSDGLNGLTNLGNTCFMNSILQCMSNCRPLRDYCLSGSFKKNLNSNSKLAGALFESYAEMIQTLWNTNRTFSPSEFKKRFQAFAPRFSGYSQQDAQEFMRYLLDGLHEDVNRVRNKPKPEIPNEAEEDRLSDSVKSQLFFDRYRRRDDSIIVDLFMGQLKSSLTCDECHNCSVTFDPFFDLSLPIPKRSGVDIEDCLKSFFSVEVLDGDEKPVCSRCKKKRKSTKSFSIERLPQILVLHLKRFSGERFKTKVSNLIQFPINDLQLSPYTNKHDTATYRLFGVSNHTGSVYSGHYFAYCRHPTNNGWHQYNDSTVSRLSDRNVVSAEAYVLFYEKTQ